MNPDDPRWLTVEPDIQPVDLQVLRQVGVPEPVLQLALRRARASGVVGAIPCHMGASVDPRLLSGPCYPDLSFLDELEEDPDARPYTWDLPEESRDYRRW